MMNLEFLAPLVGVAVALLTPIGIAIGKYFSLKIQLKTVELAAAHHNLLVSVAQTAVDNSNQLTKNGDITKIERMPTAKDYINQVLAANKIKPRELLQPIIDAQVWGDSTPNTPAVPEPIPEPIQGGPIPASPMVMNEPIVSEPIPLEGGPK